MYMSTRRKILYNILVEAIIALNFALRDIDIEIHPPLGSKNLPNQNLQVSTQVAIALLKLAFGESLKKIG